MKVLIMSDSHGLTHEISMIKERHKHEIESVIHCGDSELLKNEPCMFDTIGVRGNCDYDSAYPNDVICEIGGKRFLITHGHLYNVKMSLLNLSYKSQETEAQIVCFGHSHRPGSELIDGTLYINPGSIRYPRGRKEKSYVLLTIIGNQVSVNFYDLKGHIIDDLNRTYQIA